MRKMQKGGEGTKRKEHSKRQYAHSALCNARVPLTGYVHAIIPPPLYKPQPCPSYSRRRDCNNLGADLVRYQM